MAFSFSVFFNFILHFFISIDPNVTPSPAVFNATQFIGEWRVLSPNVGVSAMHMQFLPNSNQLLIFDRRDAGPSNLSLPLGQPCHNDSNVMDCTAHSLLFDPSTTFVRPLNIQTDTWCSSGALLPDATFIQTGGYTAGDRIVRTFDSSSVSPFSKTDWVEHPNYLSVRRWYATDQVLPDGSVIIIGGRKQFNYEFYPKPESSDTQNLFDFGFLKETRDSSEDNLYPFVHLLPDGNLFVFANTRSVILNPTRNQVIRKLPDIPDRVPRNYPSSGSTVMLPLRPGLASSKNNPAATQAEVLICGGAPYGNYDAAYHHDRFLPVASNCGRIRVTDKHPVWRMENMPIPRVMGDMVLLPTGDVLIVNGARSGSAGWNLGRDPVTAPVLYRPSAKKLDERFVVLKSSLKPRMYHSTAVLDNYGRVLVGGSNPHVRYEFQNTTYPTDLSIEAFYPPYLEARLNLVKPRIMQTDASGTVGYGSAIQVWFSCGVDLEKGDGHRKDAQVVVVAPGFATHSLMMNQRMVVLDVARVDQVGPFTYEATVSAPPTPEIAPPGYYMMFVVKWGVPSDAVWVRFG